MERTGNTVSSTIPIALKNVLLEGLVCKGKSLCHRFRSGVFLWCLHVGLLDYAFHNYSQLRDIDV